MIRSISHCARGWTQCSMAIGRYPLCRRTLATRSQTAPHSESNTGLNNSTPPHRGYRVMQVPIFSDNYAHILVDAQGKVAAIDPADPVTVVAALEKNLGAKTIDALLITHKHADHSGGNLQLAREYGPTLSIYGSAYEDCPGVTHPMRAGDEFAFGSLRVRVLYTPCHTSGHVQYLVTSPVANQQPALFCGDTLFVGGCGRFFEGKAADMHNAMEQLRHLDPQTLVYCGHEYTMSNLKFALTIEPNNEALKQKMLWADAQRAKGLSTVPSTLQEELSYNPFLRTNVATVQAALGVRDPVEVMARLREMKNNFKG